MKRFVGLGLFLLLIVVGWSGAWLFVAAQVRGAVDGLAAADGVETARLDCGTLEVSGFPFRFDVACVEATLVQGDLAFAAPEIRASALIYRPTHILAFAQGPLTFEDAFTGSQSRLDWSELEASLRLADWRIARLSIHGESLVWSDALRGDALIARSPIGELHLLDMQEQHDADAGTAALAFYGRFQEIEAPGLEIASGDLSAEAEILAVPDDIRDLTAPEALRLWQQRNGRIDIVDVTGTDTDTALNATGTLSLDSQGRPEGQLVASSTGLVERLGDLIAEPARTLVLGRPAEDGSYSQTLNIRGGVVFSGLIPTTTLPPLF